jgi:hypothetical protein
MECWKAGILGIKVKINHFKFKKTPSNPSFHYPIIPLFPQGHKLYRPAANWGKAFEFHLLLNLSAMGMPKFDKTVFKQ